ncbi:MAG: hypothetical protein ACKVS8_12305 [Phycisphaerales bacterium]
MNEERLFIVYTDIVGHTRLIDRVGVGFRPMRRVHDELFRSAAEGAGGAFCSVGTGDGFYAGFTTAGAALDTALTFRRRLAATDWDQYLSDKLKGPENAVKARVGIHCGLVKVRYAGTQAVDFDGLPRNTCDKLCALAKGNQVILSREAWDEVRLTATGASALDSAAFGFFKPKDCKEVVEVFGVAEAGAEIGACPEQPSEYGAVMFTYIDEALELLDRMGDGRFEDQFIRLEGVLQEVLKKHAPGAFMKRLGKDGFLVAADTDLDIARAGLELRRAVFTMYRKGELATILKTGADCGSVHFEYGPRGRQDVRDQPCNIAAKIAGKLSNRWQFLLSDRVKRNAHSRLSDRDEYQWVSLGRRDPVGNGETFEVIDLRDTRVRTDERPVLWVDVSHVLLQLGGMAEALKKDLTRRLGELFDRSAGSCNVKPLKADHPAGFYAVFDDVLAAFDTAVDFHAACVAEPWERTMAGLKRRHKRDSLARVGLMLGQVTTAVTNSWVDAPEGPGVDAARQMMGAQAGPGVTVLVGNSMRNAVEARVADLRGLGSDARAGRTPAVFTPVRTPTEWPESMLGKVWGVEAESGAMGNINPVVKWGLLAAAIAVVGTVGLVVFQTKMGKDGSGPSFIQGGQAPELTEANRALQDALAATTSALDKEPPKAAFRRLVLEGVKSSAANLLLTENGKPFASQRLIVPEINRLAALTALLAKPGVWTPMDEAAAAKDYLQAANGDQLRGWSTVGADAQAWAAGVVDDYTPYTGATTGGRAAWDQALRNARAALATDGIPPERRASLQNGFEELMGRVPNEWDSLAMVRRYRAKIDRVALSLDEAAQALTLASNEAIKTAKVTPAGPSPVEAALRDRLKRDPFPDDAAEKNLFWRVVVVGWVSGQLARGSADAAELTKKVDAIEAALKSAVERIENQDPEPLPAMLSPEWREVFGEVCATARESVRKAFYDGLQAAPSVEPRPEAIASALARAKDELEERYKRNAEDLLGVQTVLDAMQDGTSFSISLSRPGGEKASLRDWHTYDAGGGWDTIRHVAPVADVLKRLGRMKDLAEADSIQSLNVLLADAGNRPEAVAAAWDRLTSPAGLGGRPDGAWLAACARVLREVQNVEGGKGWAARSRAMYERAAELAAHARSTPEARNNPVSVEASITELATVLAGVNIPLEARLSELLEPEVRASRVFWQLELAVREWQADKADKAKQATDRLLEQTAVLFNQADAMQQAMPGFPRVQYQRLRAAFDCESKRGDAVSGTRRDFARIGPAVNSDRWRFVGPDLAAEMPPVLRYEYVGDKPAELAVSAGATPGVNQLEFRLLEAPTGGALLSAGGDPVYLCTTSVSVGVFMIQSQPRTRDFSPGPNLWGENQRELKEVSGLLGWRLAPDRRIDPAAPAGALSPPKGSAWVARAEFDTNAWQNLGTSNRSYFPAGLSDQRPFEPSVESPVQALRADTAAFLARTLGCRLPTDAEFQAAFDMEMKAGGGGNAKDPSSWNLRDQAFRATEVNLKEEVFKDIKNIPNLRTNARISDVRTIRDEWYESNDGAVFFMPVARPARQGNYLFLHLIGNVATFTFPDASAMDALNAGATATPSAIEVLQDRASDFHVVGRSALSAVVSPERWREPVEGSPFRVPRDIARVAFSDVGLRLALTAKPVVVENTACDPTLAAAFEEMRVALNRSK